MTHDVLSAAPACDRKLHGSVSDSGVTPGAPRMMGVVNKLIHAPSSSGSADQQIDINNLFTAGARFPSREQMMTRNEEMIES